MSPEPVNQMLVPEPISPELALVDPELATRARELLPVHPSTPPAPPSPPRLRLVVTESPEPAPRERRARRRLIAIAAAAAAAIGVAGAALLLDSREAAPVSPPEQRAAPAPPAADPLARPQFTWMAVAEARAYRFVLYRRGRPVYEASTRAPRLVLPLRWTFRGEQHRLREGTYRWVVVPRVGELGSLRDGDAIVDALYTV